MLRRTFASVAALGAALVTLTLAAHTPARAQNVVANPYYRMAQTVTDDPRYENMPMPTAIGQDATLETLSHDIAGAVEKFPAPTAIVETKTHVTSLVVGPNGQVFWGTSKGDVLDEGKVVHTGLDIPVPTLFLDKDVWKVRSIDATYRFGETPFQKLNLEGNDIAGASRMVGLPGQLVGLDTIIQLITFDGQQEMIAGAGRDGNVYVLTASELKDKDIKGAKPQVLRGMPGEFIHAMDWSGNTRYLLTGSSLGVVRVWDCNSGEVVFQTSPANQIGGVANVKFSHNGRYLAASWAPGSIHVWKVPLATGDTPNMVVKASNHWRMKAPGNVTALDFAADDVSLLVGSTRSEMPLAWTFKGKGAKLVPYEPNASH